MFHCNSKSYVSTASLSIYSINTILRRFRYFVHNSEYACITSLFVDQSNEFQSVIYPFVLSLFDYYVSFAFLWWVCVHQWYFRTPSNSIRMNIQSMGAMNAIVKQIRFHLISVLTLERAHLNWHPIRYGFTFLFYDSFVSLPCPAPDQLQRKAFIPCIITIVKLC